MSVLASSVVADREAWPLRGMLTDAGAVVQMPESLVEFVVLTVTGIVVSAVSAVLVTDYRGLLTSYAHACWRFYQRRWYRRLFLWTSSSRDHYADEARVRRTLRVPFFLGLAMGVFIVFIEFAALVTGQVI